MNNFMTSTDSKRRIYSAKPMLNDSRRLTKITQKNEHDPYFLQMSPSDKIPETTLARFTSQTAPSSDFQRSFYNPYNTVTKMTDNFLNIERPALAYNGMKTTARSTISSLSNFTQVQNSRTMTQLRALQQINEKNSEGYELSNMKHFDCDKMLTKASKDLRKINYKLKNIVSNGESHLEIFRNDPKVFEMIEGIPMFAKVGCKGLTGPAKFIIKRLTRGKVKSYTSYSATVPPSYRSGTLNFF